MISAQKLNLSQNDLNCVKHHHFMSASKVILKFILEAQQYLMLMSFFETIDFKHLPLWAFMFTRVLLSEFKVIHFEAQVFFELDHGSI